MHDLLLIQIREPGHAMEAHERDCVIRRIGGRAVRVRTANVFAERPRSSWLYGADAVVIGGSGSFSVQDPRSHPWVDHLRDLVDESLRKQIPGFAICFGHQLLGMHLGQEVVTDEDRRESGTVSVALTQTGVDDPIFGRFGGDFHVNTGHTDRVVSVPAGTTLIARNDTVETQAFRVDGAPWWSVQFHPDLTAAEATQRYRAFESALAREQGRPPDVDLELFHERGDQASELIGWWLDHVL